MHPRFFHDVAIVGAGPVGLFLACELRLAGVDVLVLERSENPHSALKMPPFGMRGLSVPTVEAFHRRGLLDAIDAIDAHAAPQRVHAAAPSHRQAGHFAGIPFDRAKIDTSAWPYRLRGPADATRAADMAHIESVLTARAIAMGVDIRRGVSVDDVAQSIDEVTVRAGTHTYRARWLVGCDGGRSVVRKAGGFGMAGTDAEFTGYSVQVDLADPDALRMGRHYTSTGMYFQSQPGTIAMVEFDGGAFHRSAPVTLDHVQAVLRRIADTDVTLTALHLATTWTDRAQQATAYRNGRLLLAGDAAHIHSPLGGQGLNLGLGDAMNLGWKLAATVRGDAADGLLDTYFDERHPVGADVLDASRAQVALMRPSRASRALERIVRDLIDTRDGATYFAARVWGVAQHIDLGGAHPLVGRSAPDFAFADGTRLGEHLREGRAVLVDFDGHTALRTIGDRLNQALRYVACDAEDRLGLTALLVRPDGVVAWACDGEPAIDEALDALSRWLSADAMSRARAKA